MVNPSILHAFARTELSRVKTDKADALRIARYCPTTVAGDGECSYAPAARVDAPERGSRAVTGTGAPFGIPRAEASLHAQMHQMKSNRLEGTSPAVHVSIRAVLGVLQEQIRTVHKQIAEHIDSHPSLKHQHALLVSIPGVSAITARQLLAELGGVAFSRAGLFTSL